MRVSGSIIAASLVLATTAVIQSASIASAAVPKYDHIFVIVMENTPYSEIVGSPDAPYINSLLARGASASQYFAVDHPSLPNYLSITSGDTYDSWAGRDCDPGPDCQTSDTNVADLIESSGYSWKAYAESMDSTCNVSSSGLYLARHVPFLYYTQISGSSRCGNVVDYSTLASDLASTASTPNYVFITPNSCNDMHDCSVTSGDDWLANNLPAILGSPVFTQQRSALVITWDEDDYSLNNQVAFIALGYGIQPGFASGQIYDHYSWLRTLEVAWGLPAMTGNDGGATVMSDIFGGGGSAAARTRR
jgi:acid phosphatase